LKWGDRRSAGGMWDYKWEKHLFHTKITSPF
jgi:hypothetical protein